MDAKPDNAKSARIGRFGCLSIIGVFVVIAAIASAGALSQKPSLNDVSRYAKHCHDLLYADAVASQYLVQGGHSPEQLYSSADRLSKDAAATAESLDAPNGFSDSDAAWKLYVRHLSDSYRRIADTLNDPNLANTNEAVQAVHGLNVYTAKAVAAFKSDLAKAPFTKQEKRRILNRLL